MPHGMIHDIGKRQFRQGIHALEPFKTHKQQNAGLANRNNQSKMTIRKINSDFIGTPPL
jgi:hypothetical protein